MSSLDLRSDWFTSTVTKHSGVTGAVTLQDGAVRIERKDLPPISVVPLGNFRINKSIVKAVLAKATPTAIVLVPKIGHYDWDARELAMNSGSTVFTFKELYTFMGEPDPRSFVDKNVTYNRARLEQHSHVVDWRMMCEASLRLQRDAFLSDLVVAIEYEYEFTEEATVRAIRRHPEADVILNANPNGRLTTAARRHTRNTKVPIFTISELMGALNYDGEQFRNYQSPERH